MTDIDILRLFFCIVETIKDMIRLLRINKFYGGNLGKVTTYKLNNHICNY